MLDKIKLGSTDLTVSRIGLGTVKMGRNQGLRYGTGFPLPSDKEVLTLLDQAKTLGINLLDTAPSYGVSEERLGKALQGHRHEWIICSKAGEEFENAESHYDFSKEAIKKSIERSLKRLKTDYIDILLIHSNGEDTKIIDQDIFSLLIEIKKAGLIRAFGMSTKTVDGGKLAVEQSDVVMVTYNPVQAEEESVLTHAHQLKKGTFIKKAFASGQLQTISGQDPVQVAMDFVFDHPGASSIIVGTFNPDHLKENVRCAEKSLRRDAK